MAKHRRGRHEAAAQMIPLLIPFQVAVPLAVAATSAFMTPLSPSSPRAGLVVAPPRPFGRATLAVRRDPSNHRHAFVRRPSVAAAALNSEDMCDGGADLEWAGGDDDDDAWPFPQYLLRPVACAGLSEAESSAVLGAAASFCEENGISFLVSDDDDDDSAFPSCEAAIPVGAAGATGRVLLLGVGVEGAAGIDGDEGGEEGVKLPDEGWLLAVKYGLSERLDGLGMDHPILVAFRPDHDKDGDEIVNETELLQQEMRKVVEEEIQQYSLREPVASDKQASGSDDDKNDDNSRFIPKIRVEIDGAMVDDVDDLVRSESQQRWDTSSVVAFDSLIDDDLRGRLLDVVLGRSEDEQEGERWDDVSNGPDPRRWERGGLLDIPDVPENDESILPDYDDDGPCWGLTHDATLDLCHTPHPALLEFESILTRLFAPTYMVTRLPESVLGSSVSPLTANAPTHGDTFDYHIDADPNLAPPSPWTDVFGRYPNRTPCKPRFISCLLYLNDEWDGEEWGAPTRFLDPPTGLTYDVTPKPGRVVFMDQDVSHTVVPPNAAAGRRPRYSLVWKLILHPKGAASKGGVTDLSCGRENWPEAVLVGSAADRAAKSTAAAACD